MPKANPTKSSAAVRRHVPPRTRASAKPSAPTIPQISGSILTSFTPDRPSSCGGEPTGRRPRSRLGAGRFPVDIENERAAKHSVGQKHAEQSIRDDRRDASYWVFSRACTEKRRGVSRFVGSTTSIRGSPSHTFAAFVVSQMTEGMDAADHHHEPVPVHGALPPATSAISEVANANSKSVLEHSH